jgi:isocitrate lyase
MTPKEDIVTEFDKLIRNAPAGRFDGIERP